LTSPSVSKCPFTSSATPVHRQPSGTQERFWSNIFTVTNNHSRECQEGSKVYCLVTTLCWSHTVNKLHKLLVSNIDASSWTRDFPQQTQKTSQTSYFWSRSQFTQVSYME